MEESKQRKGRAERAFPNFSTETLSSLNSSLQLGNEDTAENRVLTAYVTTICAPDANGHPRMCETLEICTSLRPSQYF